MQAFCSDTDPSSFIKEYSRWILRENPFKIGFGLMRLPKNEDGSIDIPQVIQMADSFLEGLTINRPAQCGFCRYRDDRHDWHIVVSKNHSPSASSLAGLLTQSMIGWLKNSNLGYPELERVDLKAHVHDLLDDLPALLPGESAAEYRTTEIGSYLEKTGIRMPEDVLTLHTARPNKDRDIEIYKRAIQKWKDGHKRLN